MKTRKEFGLLLNSLNLLGDGVEVGVCKGSFSKAILETWKGKKLHSVDSWQYQGAKMDVSDEPQIVHDENYQETKTLLSIFKERSNIIRQRSLGASLQFDALSLDFVYLDARHDYRSVWGDLEVWYPKIKKGGIISGHDYKDSCVRKNLVEVKRAVDNFFRYYNKIVHVTTDDNLPTWYVIK